MPLYDDRTKATLASLIAAIAFTAATTLLLKAGANAEDESPARRPMPVVTAEYRQQPSYQQNLHFLGLVQAASRAQVGFEIPGTIRELRVREGQHVEQGEVLATLNMQTLTASKRAAASSLAQIAAELELARARTQRQEPLRSSGAISAQTFDDTRLAEKALASRYASAEAELEMLTIELEKSTLRAPYTAVVGQQLIDTGSVTQPGNPVFALISAAEREAHIGISVEQTRNLNPGARYAVNLRGETVEAVLRAIRPDIDAVSLTATAIFDLPENVDAFDGEPVSVAIPKVVEQIGGWLPLSALLEGERGVWTVLALRQQDQKTAALREVVEVLHTSNGYAFVKGSINNGDMLITDGVHRIAPGTSVVAARSVASAAGR